MKKIIDGLVYSSLIPAFYITVFTLYAFLVNSQNIDLQLLTINFLGTFVSYNAIAFISLRFRGIKSMRMQWQYQYRYLLIVLSVLSCCGIIFLYPSLNLFQILNLGHLFFLILIYEKRSKNSFSLRAKIFIKPLIISYIWAMVAVGNVLLEGETFNWVLFAESFLSIAALSLFYDIRDERYDKDQDFRTLVHKFGIQKVKSISYRFYLLSVLLRMLIIPFASYWSLYIIEMIIYSLLLKRAKPEVNNHLYVIVVDGLIVFKLLYVLVSY